MTPPRLEILYEDNHLLALNKPAGVATMGALAGHPSLVAWAKQYIKQRYTKPGNVYLGVVSRLDAPVTGVVVLARTSKAAERLTRQFASHDVAKTYWAIVEGTPPQRQGVLIDWLRHVDEQRRVVVAKPGSAEAKEARLRYRVCGQGRLGVGLEIHLETGRKHQIRVQLAHQGWPILGDEKYGAARKFPRGIALHARRLELLHPVRQEPLAIEAPLPTTWKPCDIDFCS